MRYFALVLSLLMCAPASSAQTWEDGPTLTVPRRDAAVAVLDGEIYVIGGQNAAGDPIGSVERLGSAGSWEAVASLREERYDAAAVTYEGRIVLMGGRDASKVATDDVEAYDSEENDWESFESLGQERQGLGAAVLGGRIYAVGGAAGSGLLLTTCEVYYNGDWVGFEFWELDAGRAAFGLTVDDDAAYFGGGFGEFGPTASMRRYTIQNGTETLPPMPTARGDLAFVSDGESIFAIGGLDAESQALGVVERYDIEAQAWETMAPLTTARSGAVAAYVGGTIYVIGGRDANGSLLTSVEVLPLGSVTSEEAGPAFGLALGSPFPNPFSAQTAFTLELDTPAKVALRVYDVRGRVVATLADRPFAAGEHVLAWDGQGKDGRRLASGLYIARMTGAGVSLTRSVTLLR